MKDEILVFRRLSPPFNGYEKRRGGREWNTYKHTKREKSKTVVNAKSKVNERRKSLKVAKRSQTQNSTTHTSYFRSILLLSRLFFSLFASFFLSSYSSKWGSRWLKKGEIVSLSCIGRNERRERERDELDLQTASFLRTLAASNEKAELCSLFVWLCIFRSVVSSCLFTVYVNVHSVFYTHFVCGLVFVSFVVRNKMKNVNRESESRSFAIRFNYCFK